MRDRSNSQLIAANTPQFARCDQAIDRHRARIHSTSMQDKRNRKRVLHLFCTHLENHFGGLEAWLFNVARTIDRNEIEPIFVNLSQTAPGTKSYLGQQLQTLGDTVHSVDLSLYRGRLFLRSGPLRKLIRQLGPVDVMHTHLEWNAAWQAFGLRNEIPIRVMHIHNDHTRKMSSDSGNWKRRFFFDNVTKKLLDRYVTHCLACSREAGASVLGPDWHLKENNAVHICGIDFSQYTQSADAKQWRAKFGLTESNYVIGNVGRLADQKNHTFLLKVLERLRPDHPHVRLLLVGAEGNRSAQIRQEIAERGLEQQVIITGPQSQTDVIQIVKTCIDLFAFPSLWEGFGIALVEAQAAGLPCVISQVCSEDVVAFPEMVKRLSVHGDDAVEQWSKAIEADIQNSRKIPEQDALERIQNTRYSIRNSIKELERLYLSGRISNPV